LRPIARQFLVALLTAGLLNLSTMAAGGKTLGVVVAAEDAHLGEADAAMGTNVFTGDFLQTDPGGTLRVKVGLNQLYLTSASSAILLEEQNEIRVKLIQGTIGFSSPVANHFEIETPVGTVRAADGKPAFGEVTLIAPGKIMVAAYHGSIVVSNAGVERTIPEGEAYNVALAQDGQSTGTGDDNNTDNGNSNGTGNQQGIHNHGPIIFTAVVSGILAGAGYAVWHVVTESASAPNQ